MNECCRDALLEAADEIQRLAPSQSVALRLLRARASAQTEETP